MTDQYKYELVIIGGGPAGMTAAIYAAQAGIKTVILEKSVTGGLVNSTHTVSNFPSFPSIHGMHLMEKMREHVDGLNVPVEEVCELEKLELTSEMKTIETDEAVYETDAVILATGRKPIPLDIPVECEQVHYCAICDGPPYKNKKILVVGGGNSAFDESRYLLGIGIKHIHLVEMMDRFAAAQSTREELFSSGCVTAQLSARVTDLVLEDSNLVGAEVEDMKTGKKEMIEVDGVFVFIGQHPNNELFRSQVNLNQQGYILANTDMSTNIPGVFGAGDINEKVYRQITTAMNDGTIAALAAERFLRNR